MREMGAAIYRGLSVYGNWNRITPGDFKTVVSVGCLSVFLLGHLSPCCFLHFIVS